MRKVLFVIGAVMGSFLLGTNFRLEVNFGLDDESFLWTWVRLYQRIRRWMKGQRTPKPAPKPRPTVQQSNPFGSSPVGLGQRPSGAPPAGGPSRPVGGPSRPAGGPSSPFGQRMDGSFRASGRLGYPLPEGGDAGAVWSPRDAKWYPPGTVVNAMGGAVYPTAPGQRPLKEWDFAKAKWAASVSPKPTGGKPFEELFPPAGAAKRYAGGDYDEYDDDDEIVEDEDGKE